MVKLIKQKAMNRVVSHLPQVKDRVFFIAEQVGGRAETALARHYHQGHAYIEVTQGDVDSLVSLVDKAALSIEFGHENVLTGNYTPGLYILTGAAGLL